MNPCDECGREPEGDTAAHYLGCPATEPAGTTKAPAKARTPRKKEASNG